MSRDIATGSAPQEVIDAVRDQMDPGMQDTTDGQFRHTPLALTAEWV